LHCIGCARAERERIRRRCMNAATKPHCSTQIRASRWPLLVVNWLHAPVMTSSDHVTTTSSASNTTTVVVVDFVDLLNGTAVTPDDDQSTSSTNPYTVRQTVSHTVALLANKTEETGIVIIARWPLEKKPLTFDVRKFCIPKFRYSTLQQTTRHWWFPTSCFGVTNHREAASLWLVRQEWANNNSGSPPSCDHDFWQWSVATPSEVPSCLIGE